MRKANTKRGWRLPRHLLTALVLSVAVPACGGSSQSVEKPEQVDEEEEGKKALTRAIEAQEAGQPEVAEEHYRRARELRPQHFETAERYTRFLLSQRRPDDAVATARTFLDESMTELKAYHLLADAQLAMHDHAGAYETLSQLIDLDEGDAAAHARRGEVAIKQERFDEGIADIRKAVDMGQGNPDYRVTLGRALQDTGELDAATSELEAVLEEYPEHVDAHLALGAALRSLGQREKAFELHQKAVDLAPQEPMAHYELAISQFYQGQNDDALDSLQRATELGPDDAQIRYVHGEVLRNLKRYEEAAERYREAVERDLDHDKAATKLGLMLVMHLDRLDEADTLLQARVARHPEDATAHYLLGVTYDKQGKPAEAVAEYEKFLELAESGDPDLPEARKRMRVLKRKLP